MRPHEGSFLRTAWAVPQTAEDARSSPGSLKPNLTFQTSKAVSLPAHRSIHDRAGIPRAPFAAGLRGFPRPQPPRPLRSSARAHLPVPPPSSAPPPALTCRRRAPPPRSPARRGGPSARYLWGGRRLRPWLPPRCAARRLVTNPYRGEGDFPAGCFPASARLRTRTELSSSSCQGLFSVARWAVELAKSVLKLSHALLKQDWDFLLERKAKL